jgi:hypothetical protein
MPFGTVRPLCAWTAFLIFGASPLAAADLDQYRDFRLGSSTAAVLKLATPASPGDVKSTLLRPVLLQTLTWRPPFKSDRGGPSGDPVRRIVFSFLDDQLLKIVVEYERRRTEGLTRNDMVAALSVVYGPQDPLVSGGERDGDGALDAAIVIARWRTAETAVSLQRYDYVGEYALVITAMHLEQRARKAQAAAAALDTREAQARGLTRLRILADEAREASEKTRLLNKSTFTP